VNVNPKPLLLACACLLGGCAVLSSKEAIVFCQAADTTTTLHAVDLGAREMNPFVNWLLTNYGSTAFIAAKIAVTLLVVKAYPDLSSDLVAVLNGVTCAVAANNARIAGELEKSRQVSE
jgi:hypothetical protein